MTRQAKTLGKLLLRLEFRSKDGSARKLFMLLISYTLPGVLLPFLIFRQTTDTTGFQFTFLTFLFYSMILAITSVMEMDNLVVSKNELDVLACLPLREDLIAKAKLYLIKRYVLIISLPLLTPGAIYYYFLLYSVTHSILYLVSGFLLAFFILSVLLLLYSFTVRIVRTERVGNFTLYFQVMLILLMILGYQYISYSFSLRTRASAGALFDVLESRGILGFFPQSWFAFLAANARYILSYKFILKVILPFFITYMSWLCLRFYLTDNYGKVYEKFSLSRSLIAKSKMSRVKGEWVASGLFLNQNPGERASFALMRYMLGTDKAVRSGIIPMIIIPVALALFAFFTDQLPSPFLHYYLGSAPVFHISILVTVYVVLNTAILGVKVTNDTDAAWVYDAYPLGSRSNFNNGIRKFFFVYLILPLCSLLFIIFLLRMPFYDALIHTLFIAASAELLNTLYHMLNKTLPFTKINTLINSLQRIGSLVIPVIYGIIFTIIQYFAYRNRVYTLIAVIAVFLTDYFLAALFLKRVTPAL
jgi:hypothetical protein